jgi:DNA-binding GntR family transcriptional regulator
MEDPGRGARLGGGELGGGRVGGTQQQLSGRVAAQLREAIMVGELRPSTFVRVEHVAAGLGVSATPVREALMVLYSEGAVRWEPRRGFRVVPLTRGDVDDLFAVQAHVAGELAARAAPALPPSEVVRLGQVQAAISDAAARGDTARVEELNHDVHRTLNRAAGAHRLASMLNLFVHYVPRQYYGRVPGWADATTHDHGAILGALEKRDAEAARAAMSEHILHIGRLLAAHLEASGVLAAAPEERAG